MRYWRLNAVTLYTLLHREVRRFLRIWSQTLLPSAITMSLYFLIFGHLIGPRVGTIHDVPYIQYIVPGLIIMSMLTNAYGNTVASFYGQRFQRSIEEMIVAPMPNWVILTGFVLGGVLRGLCVGAIVTAVALFFTHIVIHNIWVILLISILTCVLFSTAGIINGVFAKKFDDINIVPVFILTPLSYLGGIFYSLDMLHGVGQVLSYLNPIFYIVNAFRYGFIGVSDVSVLPAMLVTGLVAMILVVYALRLLNKGVGIRT